MNRKYFSLIMTLAGLSATVVQGQTQTPAVITPYSLTTVNDNPYTQNFDTNEVVNGPGLANGVNDTTSATVPAGWGFVETGTGTNSNGLYRVHTGSSAAVNDTYSFGSGATATDRAFGEITGGATSVSSKLGAQFTNNTGSVITFLTISYTGEQWHRDTGTGDRLDFRYSTNATVGSLTAGTFTDFDALDFNALQVGTSAGLDGNAAANRTTITATITGLNIGAGQTFTIRWDSIDVAGGDAGLSIDNFTLTPVPEPSTWIGGAVALGFVAWSRRQRQSRR